MRDVEPDGATGSRGMTGAQLDRGRHPRRAGRVPRRSVVGIFAFVLEGLMFSPVRSRCLVVVGHGTQDAIMPLINTAAVIGFGGVLTHTSGFEQFTRLML